MKPENAEALGTLADGCDNLSHGPKTAIPQPVLLQIYETKLREISELLKDIVIDETGENPWAD